MKTDSVRMRLNGIIIHDRWDGPDFFREHYCLISEKDAEILRGVIADLNEGVTL